MKKTGFLLAVLLFTCGITGLFAQSRPVHVREPETDDMREYIMVSLKKAPAKKQSKEEIVEIENAHVENIKRMTEDNMLAVYATYKDGDNKVEVLILNITELQAAKDMIAGDPAVQAGQLLAEYRVWKAKAGSCLPH